METILDAVLSAQQTALHNHPTRPFVCVTWAQSLDGMIASAPGTRTSLSGPASMAMTHGLRAVHDAILVGVGTVLVDDPRLSCRASPDVRAAVDAALARCGGQMVSANAELSPRAVVLDAALSTPPEAKFLSQPCSSGPVVFAALGGKDSDAGREEALSRRCVVERVPVDMVGGKAGSARLKLSAVLGKLREHGVSSVMVEGGASVISSFLGSGLCDLIVVTVAPTLFRQGLPISAGSGQHPPFNLLRLADPRWLHFGDDIVVVGTPT